MGLAVGGAGALLLGIATFAGLSGSREVAPSKPTAAVPTTQAQPGAVAIPPEAMTQVPAAVCFEKIVLKGSRTLEITYSKDRVNAGEVLAAVAREGLGVVDVTTKEPDLEDVFLDLIGDSR